jgi:hypothetical protein
MTGSSAVADPSELDSTDGDGAAEEEAATDDAAGAATPDETSAECADEAGVPFDERRARIAV